LLVEGPSVLGLEEATAIDRRNAAATLEEGLAETIKDSGVDIASLARLVSAAFDRAALEIDAGRDSAQTRTAMLWLLRRLLGDQSLYGLPESKTGWLLAKANPLIHWSGRSDSNTRLLAPHASALPGCATPRAFDYSICRPIPIHPSRPAHSSRSSSIAAIRSARVARTSVSARVWIGSTGGRSASRPRTLGASSPRRLRAPLIVKPCS